MTRLLRPVEMYERLRSGLAGYKFLNHPYYYAQLLLSLCFIAQRKTPCLLGLAKSCPFHAGERQILMLLAITLTLKARQALSVEGYLSLAFAFAQVANLILLAKQCNTILAGLASALAYSCLLVLRVLYLPQPPAPDPGRRHISYITVESLLSMLNGDERCPSALRVVCLYAVGSAKCNAFAPVFSRLAAKFADKDSCQFYKIDVGRSTSSQQEIIKDRFEVDVSALTVQLPAVLLFYKGALKRKIVPQRFFMAKQYIMSEENLIRDLELPRLSEEVKQVVAKSKSSKKKL